MGSGVCHIPTRYHSSLSYAFTFMPGIPDKRHDPFSPGSTHTNSRTPCGA